MCINCQNLLFMQLAIFSFLAIMEGEKVPKQAISTVKSGLRRVRNCVGDITPEFVLATSVHVTIS